jgi:hypothetical protein
MDIPAPTPGEPRVLVLAFRHDKHRSAVITDRDSTLCLISVRRFRLEMMHRYVQLRRRPMLR